MKKCSGGGTGEPKVARFARNQTADAARSDLYSGSMRRAALSHVKSAFCAVLALVSLACASGCVYASGRTIRQVGPQISPEAVAAITPGRTTLEWLTATFGDPTSAVCLDDGSEIYRYDTDVRTTEGWYLFMLFTSSTNRIERTSWWFEVRDGIVMRCWGEECEPIDISPLSPAPVPENPAIAAENALRSAPVIEIDPETGDALPPNVDVRPWLD